jgi:nucleotide-binding universal stress UspA family protein
MFYNTNHRRLAAYNGAAPRTVASSDIADSSEYSHILIPTGMQRRDLPAVLLGLQMAAALNAKATVLHVAPMPEPTNPLHWLDAIENLHRAMAHPGKPASADEVKELLEESRTRVRAYLEREIPVHLRTQVDIDVECCLGDVADEILRFASVESVDLVVLSSRLSRWWLPVVPPRVHRMLQRMRKRVIVVRPDTVKAPKFGDSNTVSFSTTDLRPVQPL